MNIKGSGGGKGGGGSSRAPIEAKDSLRSKQFAKVLDLVSEGEIDGLQDGLKSVYLDGTPIINSNGSYNFTGVNLTYNNGTQNQSYITGIGAAEAEVGVGVEVKYGFPITRTISDATLDAIRVTLSTPQLSSQDTSTGDLSGTSVEYSLAIQNNGGGFYDIPLRTVQDSSKFALGTISYNTVAASWFSIDVKWNGVNNILTVQNATVSLQRRPHSGGSWVTVDSYLFSGCAVYPTAFNGLMSTIYSKKTPSASKTFNFTLTSGQYDFQVVISGTGSASITKGTIAVQSGSDIISGKTTTKYQRAYKLALPAPGPWDIRITRITPDSTSVALQNKTFWDSYTEIIVAKLSYPNSALSYLEVDASQFKSIPTRGYLIKGIKVKIPSNYDPIARTYSGIWDGTFTVAWSDNPAWVFYDILTNTRYGLGDLIAVANIDKWTLYTIAQYCDVSIRDGFGGFEPRFTCNLYLQSREDAYKLLNNIASIFRGIIYWSNGQITAVQDAPTTVTKLFHASNVIGGSFSYSGSSAKTRHTVALVSWNDPEDLYKQKVEYVEDQVAVAKYGVIQTELVAFGCTSRGQAHRMGSALLYTEQYEGEVVSFGATLDHLNMVYPGAIIQIQDRDRSGADFGGRILSATTSTINIDRPIIIESGKSYAISCELPNGAIETKTITNAIGTTQSITIDGVLSSAPNDYSMWVISSSSLIPESWRVLSVSESSSVEYSVTAMAYRADKYSAIEDGLSLSVLPTSSITVNPEAPTGVSLRESLTLVGTGLVGVKGLLSWNAVATADNYYISYRKTSENWVTSQSDTNSLEIVPMLEGDYEFSITAQNSIGRKSPSTSYTATVYGKTINPSNVTGLSLAVTNGLAYMTWDAAIDLDVPVGGYMQMSHTSDVINPIWENSVNIGQQLSGNSTNGVFPLIAGTYMAKWFDSSGHGSTTATMVITNAPSVVNMNAVVSFTENPTWTGAFFNTIYDSALGGVKLLGITNFDSLSGNIDTWGNLDSYGGIISSGHYTKSGYTDLGSVVTSRITSSLSIVGYSVFDNIDARTQNIDTWTSWDGSVISDVSCIVQIRTTEDDPSLTPVWSAWQNFYVGDWRARAFQFRLLLTSGDISHNLLVKEFSVTIDMPDKLDSTNDIVSGTGIKSIIYNASFKAISGLGITAENMQTGDYYTITNKTVTGFDIQFFNSLNVGVSKTFDYIVRGY